MNKVNINFTNNNILGFILAILLLIYLYLDTPLPFVFVLNNLYLMITIIISIIIFLYLCVYFNIFLAIIFALVVFEIIRKSLEPNLQNIDKSLHYYNTLNVQSSEVISEKLKTNNTLEEEMILNVKSKKNNSPLLDSPRYQALLPNLEGTSNLE